MKLLTLHARGGVFVKSNNNQENFFLTYIETF